MTPERLIIESMLIIADKNGEDVPMLLNPAQVEIDETLSGRDLYPKARQEGVSSYFLARYFVKCLSQRNVRAVIISHDRESTQRLLLRVHKFIKMMDPKPVINHASKNEITFPKMDSMIYLGTAGARKFGRGDTITHLHCSEVAFWPEAQELVTGLLQAVPRSGEVAMESTGNGKGNYYHKMCMDAASGKSHYKLHFLPWHTFPEYDLAVTDQQADDIISTLDADIEEDILYHNYKLSPGQLLFRRERLAELNWDINGFKQEYPMSLDECFQASGSGLFDKVRYEETKDWKRINGNLSILEPHPIRGHSYILGADVSGGVGKDRSTCQILDLSTLEQVGEWSDDSTTPDDFANIISTLAKRFNNAFVTVESNNYGITTLDRLKDIYPRQLIYYEAKRTPRGANEFQTVMNLGFRTTAKTKPFIIGKLRSMLTTDIVIHSIHLKNELDTFVEHDDGTLGAVEGCFDDLVMALAVGLAGINRAALYGPSFNDSQAVVEYDDPFSFENVVEKFRGRNSTGHYLSRQTPIIDPSI